MLNLSLLGSPQCWTNNQNLSATLTGKTFALFIYCASTGQPQARNLLADLLWSELSNQQVRNNLRYLLADLRKVVGDYLTITPRTIGFNFSQPYWLDVEHLRTLQQKMIADVSTADLQRTMDVYRGEFLAGFQVRHAPTFESWVVNQHEELHRLAIQGFYRLSECYYQQGNAFAGLNTTQRLLELEPWYEAGHRLRMQLFAQIGQRSAAIEQYHLLRRGLIADWGIEPNEKTVTLYTQIINGTATESVLGLNNTAITISPSPQVISRLPISTLPISNLSKHNLPGHLTPFIGRVSEITAIEQTLHNPNHRLITLVGEGGTGKTRLALAVAQAILQADDLNAQSMSDTAYISAQDQKRAAFADGMWYVPLVALQMNDNYFDLLATAVANAMQLPFQSNRTLHEQLFTQLRNKQALIIFDNFEHLIDGSGFIIELLQFAPAIKVLITSRRILNFQAETIWRVEGLPTPTTEDAITKPPDQLLRYDAISLFAERASRLVRGFEVTRENQHQIVRICQFVQGLPLGVELAAALLRTYSCLEIAVALQQNYKILESSQHDISPRHRNIQATLAYSWSFLSQSGGQVLAQCSIFRGGFQREAALNITGATLPVLTLLEDHSLLHRLQSNLLPTSRYDMHVLVRQFAAEQLATLSSLLLETQERHATFYIKFLHLLEHPLFNEAQAQIQVQVDIENVRAAWLWCCDHRRFELLAQGLTSLTQYYRLMGLNVEARDSTQAALTRIRESTTALSLDELRLLARLLTVLAEFCRYSGELDEADIYAKQALSLGEQIQDTELQALAYNELARLAQAIGQPLHTIELAERSYEFALQAQVATVEAEALNTVGVAYLFVGNSDRATTHFHAAMECLERVSNRHLEAKVTSNLGIVHHIERRYSKSLAYRLRSFEITQSIHQLRGRRISTILMGDLLQDLGDYQDAKELYSLTITSFLTMPDAYWEAWLYVSLGSLYLLSNSPEIADTHYKTALQIASKAKLGYLESRALTNLGHTFATQQDWQQAEVCYRQAISLQQQAGITSGSSDSIAGLAKALISLGKTTEALVQVNTVLQNLTQKTLYTAYQPFQVYTKIIFVLQVADDPRRTEVLYQAHQSLLTQAEQIDDEQLRYSFLNNVAVNQEIISMATSAMDESRV